MNTRHLSWLLAIVTVTVVTAGCGSTAQTSPSASASTAPSSASASPKPSATAAPAACKVKTQTFKPPTDQLVSMVVSTVGSKDRVVFRFGPNSGQPVRPAGRIRTARAPFTEMASGQTVKVRGKRFVEVAFSGLYLFDSYGRDAFQGALDRHPSKKSLRDIISIDSFEGHMTWILGYNGTGCVTLRTNRSAHTVTVEFAHAR